MGHAPALVRRDARGVSTAPDAGGPHDCTALFARVAAACGQAGVQAQLITVRRDRAGAALAILGVALGPADRVSLERRLAPLPAAMRAAIDDLLIRAANAGIDFAFRCSCDGRPSPCVGFDLEESGITVHLRHEGAWRPAPPLREPGQRRELEFRDC